MHPDQKAQGGEDHTSQGHSYPNKPYSLQKHHPHRTGGNIEARVFWLLGRKRISWGRDFCHKIQCLSSAHKADRMNQR